MLQIQDKTTFFVSQLLQNTAGPQFHYLWDSGTSLNLSERFPTARVLMKGIDLYFEQMNGARTQSGPLHAPGTTV